MLVTGRALMGDPKVMPSSTSPPWGLPPCWSKRSSKSSKHQSGGKVAILLVEQNAAIALEFAHYGYIMETGRVVLDGPTEKAEGE